MAACQLATKEVMMVTNRQLQIERNWPVYVTGGAGLHVDVSTLTVSLMLGVGITPAFQGTGAPVAPTFLSSDSKDELRT